jgi:ABC-type antimicrobial peptide transport system permease subunit
MPAAQWHPEQGGLFVRARDVRTMLDPVRLRLQREMPGTSFVTVTPLGDNVDVTMRSWIIGTKVFSVFGALALVLAALGLSSVVAYDVAQRRHELGVRLALGASRAGIVRLVVVQSLRFALTGVAIGTAGALIGGPHIGPLLFRQSPRDPAVFAFVSVVLIGVAILASWLPALRAARLDPTTALRVD